MRNTILIVIVTGLIIIHLSVLIETMRREGYELQVGQPQMSPDETAFVFLRPKPSKVCSSLILDPDRKPGSVVGRYY